MNTYIKIFNQIVDEFFNELIEIFPEETKIKTKYILFQGIIKVNIKKVCLEFMINIIPYLEQIAMRDEQFFLGNGKPKILEGIDLWKTDLSPATKIAVWKYIQSLITIGSNVIEMPEEKHNLISYIINFPN